MKSTEKMSPSHDETEADDNSSTLTDLADKWGKWNSNGSAKEEKFEQTETLNWAEEMLDNVQIDGDTYKKDADPYAFKPYWVDAKLTVDDLKDEKLEPRELINVGDKQIGLSRAFLMPNQRYAILGYVQSGDEVKLRTYYRSLSSGMWRYLPAHVGSGPLGRTKEWYDKGYGEQSLSLPPVLQDACNAAVGQIERPIASRLYNPDLVFRGTCYHYDTRADRTVALKNNEIKGDYFQEVDKNAYRFGYGNGFLSRMLYDPDGDKSFWALPNFEQEEVGEEMKSPLRGEEQEAEAQYFTPHRFLSNDGNLLFTFMENRVGDVYLANLEITNSEITSMGIAKSWVESGTVITPLYEYRSQSKGRADAEEVLAIDEIYGDKEPTPYVKMSNYLNQMPLIREYKRVQARKRGEEVEDGTLDMIAEFDDDLDKEMWEDYLFEKENRDI